jgi:acyl-CoA synthetase
MAAMAVPANATSGWELRVTPAELAARYRREGHWTDETLGLLLHEGLRRGAANPLRIWSASHPYQGTIGAVDEQARLLAAGLAGRGLGPGDVVAFQLPNWVEAAATFWGLALLGVTLVPIVHFYGSKEVEFILAESGAKALITADRFGHLDYLANLAEFRRRLPAMELVVTVGAGTDRATDTVGFDDVVARARAPIEGPAPVDPDQPTVVAYTSGTTADPKGVIHTHRSLVAELRQGQHARPADRRPIMMGAPVGHGIGMLGGLLGPVVKEVGIHLIDVWQPATVLHAMATDDLVFSGGATYFLTSLLDAPEFTPAHLAQIPSAGLGGSPVPAAVAERAAGLGIALFRSYGSTEHPSITGASLDEPEAKRLYTDGHPLAGVEMRLVDGQHRQVRPGEPGEIESRGPELFAGYTDPALTKEAVDADGWYSTGDIGVVDGDGWLTITDRKRDIIIRGGENISAAEVEGLVVRMPGVAEVAVVAAPDARLGEHACAFLRLQPGAPPPVLDDVRRHLQAAGLARQKWPEELRVVDDFPRTPSSKVKKFVLRDQLRGR